MTIPAADFRWTTSNEDNLRRHGLGRQRNRDRVRQDDFGGGGGEVLAHEAAVVGDDDPLGLLAALQHVFGHRPSTAADVVEREVLGYPCPQPSVPRRSWSAPCWLRCAQGLFSLVGAGWLDLAISSAIIRTSCERSAEQMRSASGVSTTMVSVSPMVTTNRSPARTRPPEEPRSRLFPVPAAPGTAPAGEAACQASRSAAQLPRSLQPTSMGTTATALRATQTPSRRSRSRWTVARDTRGRGPPWRRTSRWPVSVRRSPGRAGTARREWRRVSRRRCRRSSSQARWLSARSPILAGLLHEPIHLERVVPVHHSSGGRARTYPYPVSGRSGVTPSVTR